MPNINRDDEDYDDIEYRNVPMAGGKRRRSSRKGSKLAHPKKTSRKGSKLSRSRGSRKASKRSSRKGSKKGSKLRRSRGSRKVSKKSSRKGSRKGSKLRRSRGSRKASRGSKRASKGSRKASRGSRKLKREMPPAMKEYMKVRQQMSSVLGVPNSPVVAKLVSLYQQKAKAKDSSLDSVSSVKEALKLFENDNNSDRQKLLKKAEEHVAEGRKNRKSKKSKE